jgi:hypothetical protein
MDWIRENKVLATIMGISLAGVIGLAVVLFMSYSTYGESMETFQRTDAGLAAIKGRALAPTQENLDKKGALVNEYTNAVNALGTALLSLQPQVKPISDTEFQVKLKERTAAIRAAAAAAGMELPADFAFGFGEYVAGLPRNTEAATAMSDYLDGVEAVINAMVKAGVKKLSTIERTALAIEKEAPPAKPEPPKSRRDTRSSKAASKGKAPAEVKKIAAVVEPRTISLTLTTDQVPLQIVLNELASPSKTEHFTSVRLLRIENEKQVGPSKSAIQQEMARESGIEDVGGAPPVTPPSAAAVGAAPGAGARVIDPVLPAKKDAVDVLGAEMLQVYMEIDLIRFLEPTENAEDGSAK